MDDTQLEQLRKTAAKTGDFRDMLAYRNALKRTGRKRGELDLHLPHKWQVVGADRIESYGAVRQLLAELCRDDGGLQPFFLREARPLTFKETIQARLDQWRTSGGKDWSLWKSWLDTSTAIVYEAGGRNFKIVPLSQELLNAPRSVVSFFPIRYADVPGTPLEVDETYNRSLTIEEVIEHKGWLAAVEGDKELLREYSAVAFGQMGIPAAMQFCVIPTPRQDRLLCLSTHILHYYRDFCNCNGNRYVGSNGRFARLSPP